MGREQAEARLGSQASREQRLAVATLVVDNSGTLADLDRRVDELWAELCRRAGARTRPDPAAPRADGTGPFPV
jgi:dephospho-CoA kinase